MVRCQMIQNAVVNYMGVEAALLTNPKYVHISKRKIK